MLDTIFDTVCRVGIFVMCAQTIVHFKPKEVYERYLRYLVSIMVLIQLFLPLGSFLFGGGDKELSEALEQFKKELEQSVAQAEMDAAAVDRKLEEMTLEEVRKQIEQQAAQEEAEGIRIQGQTESAGISENQEKDVASGYKTIEIEPIPSIVVGE